MVLFAVGRLSTLDTTIHQHSQRTSSAIRHAYQQLNLSDQTQPSTDSTELPRTLWCDPVGGEAKPLLSDSPQKPSSKMASICVPFLSPETKECGTFANPDVYTSAGLVANAYSRFRTQFWIDRILVWLTVIIPTIQAIILILLHTIMGLARCVPLEGRPSTGERISSNFFDRACGLQLTSNVLQGKSPAGPSDWTTVQLQHECYPFLLWIIAILMWIPHFVHQRAIDKTARRDLCLVRSELHSFRRAVGQELNYLQAISAASMDGGVHTTTFLSPGSTMPTGPTLPPTAVRYQTGPLLVPHQRQHDGNSGRTTAATVGGASLLSQTPAPTVIQAPIPPCALNRRELSGNRVLETSPVTVPLNYGDADFSAPGLLDLPCFRACHADWSLNTYLSAWQNTEFYWRRYLAKHAVLATFQILTTIALCTLVGFSKGTPFMAIFHCNLEVHDRQTVPAVCMLHTTFILNMSILCWTCISLTGLGLQAVYFYTNFVRTFGGPGGRYLGVTSRPTTFVTGLDETRRCFFADYIRLLAYTAFRDTQCEIRSLSVSYSRQLYRSDFHFISLLCTENAELLPDAIHIHFWTERYARLCRRQYRRPYWAIRRGSLGHLVRCEDLSMKFNFSKIRIKVEVNDFGC
ncbi:hypothetical protein AHF37_09621 [Paragonimus kellicotti]|nr:hypothetical protein AHF37_09621 [Paragonimus kellicotti]